MTAKTPVASGLHLEGGPLSPPRRRRAWKDTHILYNAVSGPAAAKREAHPVPPRALLLLAFATVVALRLPLAWAHGRFLDEEGGIFFAYAWRKPAAEALLRSFGGYLNLGANAATLADARAVQAGWWPLEAAPYFTMLVALAAQCIPAALVIWGRAPWLGEPWARPAALLAIAAAPMTEEVFLDTLHIQFHLALAAALILALDLPSGRPGRMATCAILLLGPLCGPGAIVLLPLFAFRTLVDRSSGRLAQTAALAVGTAVQLAFFFHGSPVRGRPPSPAVLATVLLVRMGALPFLTRWGANAIGAGVHHSWAAGGLAWVMVAALALALAGALLAWTLRDSRDGAVWLALAAGGVAVAEFGGGMIASDPGDWWSMGFGERYDFVPIVLLLIAFVALANRPPGRGRTTARVLLCLGALSGVSSYVTPIPEMRRGPAWDREVAMWRQDHRWPLRVWPEPWTMDLSDTDRPCTPPRSPGVPTSDPSWCESAWVSAVTLAPGTPLEERLRAEKRRAR